MDKRKQELINALWIISEDHPSLWNSITNLCPSSIGLRDVFKKNGGCISGQCGICWCRAMKKAVE